eukprot:SAG11_NODE_35062_length_268_cov_1.213018_1_plen_44_part_10
MIENCVEAADLAWWALNRSAPLVGPLANALGAEQVAVYRYADRE